MVDEPTWPILRPEPPFTTLDPPVPKSPVADHIICMTCGAHVEHGMMNRHYEALHPDAIREEVGNP